MVAASAPSAEMASLAAPARPTEPSGAVTHTYDGQPAPASIGWLWPDDTAQGGGVPGWRPPRRWTGGDGWRYRTATLVALGAVLLAGAGVVIGMALHSSAPKTPAGAAQAATSGATGSGQSTGHKGKKHDKASHGGTTAASGSPASSTDPSGNPKPTNSTNAGPPPVSAAVKAATAEAATWVHGQVASSTAVACDPQACAALASSGFTGATVQIGKNSTSLSNAGLVVVTPEFLKLAGSNPGLRADVTPIALASFVNGNAQVTVRVVYPQGGAAYVTALKQSVTKRANIGKQLVSIGKVSTSASARSDLTSGSVDQRLMLIIKALAVVEPLDVVGFTDSGPGASSGVPFRLMVLAANDPAATVSAQAYLQAMLNLLQAHGAHAIQTTLNGHNVVEVGYSAPTPLS